MSDETKTEEPDETVANDELEHTDGGPTTRDASDVGVPMTPGDPSEPVGPEDALGEGLKRGDYSSRVPGNHTTVVSTGEPEPIYAYIKDGKEVKPGTAGAERVLVDYKPGTRVVDQTAGLADVGDASGLKGGVETAAA